MTTAARAPRLALLVLLPFTLGPRTEADWPQLGGPNRDGTAADASVPEGELRLETLWKKKLGSGYSGISVVGDSAVTMYSSGASDYLAALDTESGATRWTLSLGEAYQGHDGSDDGPLSTPLVHGGRVFAVTPRGSLLAAGLEDGKKLWETSLTEAYQAATPEYGFTTSPIVAGGLVAVQVGGPAGHGLCAFDPATGELRWSLGDDPAGYRSPAPVTVLGRTHLVVVGTKTIRGVDPQTGKTLWEHTGSGDGYEEMATLLPIGSGRFLVTGWAQIQAFEIVPAEAGFTLADRWTTTEIKQTYGPPVHRDGRLYGYSGSYLVAVDAATGKLVWKSREPGKGVSIGVGDQLAVWAQGGKLYLAPTGEDGFAPIAQADVFQTVGLTPPAYADGIFYLRNLSEVAAVALRAAPTAALGAPAGTPAPAPTSGTIGRFLAKFDGTVRDSSELDEYLDEQGSFPLVEPGGLVHFVYRGGASDVGVYGPLTPSGSQSLARIPGTDVFFRTYRLQPGARIEYSFVVDFGERQADPKNPAVAPGADGKRSELQLPGWEVPDYAVLPFADPTGKLESFDIVSAAMGETRKVSVYLPAGYAASQARYPLIVVPDVQGTLANGKLPEIVDRLTESGRAPVIVAFVPFGPGFAYWVEGYAARRDDMVRFVTEEILPEVAKRYRVREGREQRAAVGFGWGAYPALYAAVTRSDVFGKVATVSLMTYEPLNEELSRILDGRSGSPALDTYVGWGLYDSDEDFGEHINLRAMNRAMAEILGAHGHRVTTREISAGTGWGSWWTHVGPALGGFFAEP